MPVAEFYSSLLLQNQKRLLSKDQRSTEAEVEALAEARKELGKITEYKEDPSGPIIAGAQVVVDAALVSGNCPFAILPHQHFVPSANHLLPSL